MPKKKKTLDSELKNVTANLEVPKELKKIAKRPFIQSCSDPHEELRRLVQEYVAHTKTKVALINMTSDKIITKGTQAGEARPCRLSVDVQGEMRRVAEDVLDVKCKELTRHMQKVLKAVPIYDRFLKHVPGVGPVLAAYLVAFVNIRISEKPSQLRRYCGAAVRDGRLEKPVSKELRGYNVSLRTALYLAWVSLKMTRNNGTEHGGTSKYWQVWENTKMRELGNPRYNAENNTIEGLVYRDSNTKKEVHRAARKYIDSKGMWKSIGVFLEDLYIVWRSIEGLPVWPTYQTAKHFGGFDHGGKYVGHAPRVITVEEALAVVGEFGKQHLSAPTEIAAAAE